MNRGLKHRVITRRKGLINVAGVSPMNRGLKHKDMGALPLDSGLSCRSFPDE